MIKHVTPAELHDWWEPVATDLDECRKHDKEEVWLEDIYCAIRTGSAFLYVALLNGQYAGMMVITRHQDQWQPSRHWLHVWYLNTHGPVLEEGLAFLDDLARQQGAAMVTFRADKLAWERWGKKLGFTLGEIELRREIDYG